MESKWPLPTVHPLHAPQHPQFFQGVPEGTSLPVFFSICLRTFVC